MFLNTCPLTEERSDRTVAPAGSPAVNWLRQHGKKGNRHLMCFLISQVTLGQLSKCICKCQALYAVEKSASEYQASLRIPKIICDAT